MTTTAEAARIVLAVNERAIRLQLDTGTIAVNEEDPAAVVSAFAPIIGHVHASEPDLAPLGAGAPTTPARRGLWRSICPSKS